MVCSISTSTSGRQTAHVALRCGLLKPLGTRCRPDEASRYQLRHGEQPARRRGCCCGKQPRDTDMDCNDTTRSALPPAPTSSLQYPCKRPSVQVTASASPTKQNDRQTEIAVVVGTIVKCDNKLLNISCCVDKVRTPPREKHAQMGSWVCGDRNTLSVAS